MKLLPLLVAVSSLVAQAPSPQGPGAQRPGPMLVPQHVVLPRGNAEITVDGTLSDWPELPAMRLDDTRQISGTALNAWNGPRDLNAIAFLMWDETHLFLACSVKDEWHRGLDANSLTLSEIPIADSVMFTFDPDRNTRNNGPDPGRAEDREFWLADENAREVVQWDRLRGTARVLDGNAARMAVLHDKEQSITTYEAKIPWSEILPVGRKADAGTVLDLQVVVNDFDESTDPMPQTRIGWTFGCSPIVDPGLFASIMLVKDRDALQGKMPDFPPKPGMVESSCKPVTYWNDLTARLLQRGPEIHDGSKAPEEAGGVQRMGILEEIDRECERYPRVDFVEFCQRIHRRMNREVAGFQARGLPSWWNERLKSLSKSAADPVPNGTVRLFRLPMGGWLFATPSGGFLVDPAGADLQEYVWGRAEFCILTQPLDMTRRNDQLLVRMMNGKQPRPVLTHAAFHLPAVAMADMPLVEQGTKFGPPAGTQMHALGSKGKDGSVTWSCSYRLDEPKGPRMMVVGPSLGVEDVGEGPVDAMIASPRNPRLLEIVAKVQPQLVILDDAFLCQSLPQLPRMSLKSLYLLQKALQPRRSLLLAPGESWDVVRAN